MVGVLQFFDFGQTSSSRKLLALNRHNSGLEPPRNSLEVPPMNTCHNFQLVHEDIQCSSYYKEDVCQQSHTKKLIAVERLHRTKDQHNRPSVVARLMGMESLPSDTKPTIHPKELNDHKRLRKKANFVSSSRQPSFMTKPIEHPKNLFPCDIKRDFNPHSGIYEIDKPLPREHPQEELLQKFKKEFEAWQVSKVQELKHDPLHRRYMNTLSQGSLNNEKVSRYHVPSARSVIDHDEQANFLEYEESVSNIDDNGVTKHDASTTVFDYGQSMCVSPGRIVILKPNLEVNDGIEESCLCSPLMLKKQTNMHDFLEQVKERLIVEMQGKPRAEITTRWTEHEIFVSEALADSEQISSKTFKRNGGPVSTGDKIATVQAKSTSSYRNEIQFRGKSSPGFISMNATKSSEKMENVLKDETERDSILIFRQKPITYLSNKEAEKETFGTMHHFLNKENANLSYLEKRKALNVSKSFRRDQTHAFDDESESPKNLTRSYSAPVSGTEFRKLLLEDRNVLTAAHIHRTHETSDNNIIEQRKAKKDGFNIRNRVSSLRQNLMLKSKIFGKRRQLMDQSLEDEIFFMTAIETTPSVLMNIAFEQDNSTEVPPSPASVCSSSYDEICRPYYPSPVSPLEAVFDEDFPSLPPYEELNSDRQDTSYLFPESNLSEELEYDGSTEAKGETKQTKNELQEFECTAKAYVRNILFTSGLFDKSHSDQALWEWGTPRKPISMLVFEEVEETYQISCNMESSTSLLNGGNTEVSHRILFDLLNEALMRAVQNSKPDSAFKKWDIGKKRLPHGNELLETLWQQIQLNICPPEDELCSMLSMVARDLSTSWSSMLHEDLDIICADMESLIIENLTDELVDNLGFSCVQCY
ncbi:uncharacterized protein LOC122024810 [Zingiber officinale]|uniref:uncharacterized protein LOC122024810 n=1 Tax=Zingiber officinale TaxID=94328 RepID=UPI001C4B6B78|nr:uncharacterized protein LOC122024810 [Zingiber officinale]XP_042439455.1 uncharacterized protein LOC122024810 [Zingiber officinale]XP_042439456.1 uncharacterized protein LOC122024810 [Zingiber officinale]XP_042439457.1 uncharacterized protein LOC122024810 [Zingiber officinale]